MLATYRNPNAEVPLHGHCFCAPARTTGPSTAELAPADAGLPSFASGFTLAPSNAPPYRRSIGRELPTGECPWDHGAR